MSPDLIDRLVSAGVVSEAQLVPLADGRPEDAPRGISERDVEEIRGALLRMGYTTLVVRVPALSESSGLVLDGRPLTQLRPSKKPSEFRMTTKLPNSDNDRVELVALDTERDNRPLRWQRWVQRRTGTANTVDFSPNSILPLSFSVTASRPANPHVVYAGDVVRLQCEAGAEGVFQELYWIVFENAAQVEPDTFSATPTPLGTVTGVPSMLDLRKRVASTLGSRDSLFDAPQARSRVIGSGSMIDWRPQFESAQVSLMLLGFDRAGQWSLSSRTVQVIDGRPAVWMMPETTLERGALADFQPSFPYGSIPKPLDIYAIQDVMAQATFQGVAGQAIAFTVHQTDFRDAQAPARQITVDWGDGSPASDVSPGAVEGAQLTHAFAQAGEYRVNVRATDVFGMVRDVATRIRISEAEATPAPAAPPASAPAAPQPERPRVEVALRQDVDSFELFRQCVRRWAGGLVRRLDGAVGEGPIVVALLPDPGPGRQNHRVAVLKDQAVVEASVADGLLDGGAISGIADQNVATLAALLKGSENLAELSKQDANALARVFGAGRAVAFQAGRPDSNTGDLFLQILGESILSRGLKLSEREGEWSAALALEPGGEAAKPDRLVCFKVKRAGVVHTPVPSFVRREAKVYTMVRVYDLTNRTVVKSWTQEESVTDLVTAYDYSPDDSSWDSFPPGFMATAPAGGALTATPTTPAENPGDRRGQPASNPSQGTESGSDSEPVLDALLNRIGGG